MLRRPIQLRLLLLTLTTAVSSACSVVAALTGTGGVYAYWSAFAALASLGLWLTIAKDENLPVARLLAHLRRRGTDRWGEGHAFAPSGRQASEIWAAIEEGAAQRRRLLNVCYSVAAVTHQTEFVAGELARDIDGAAECVLVSLRDVKSSLDPARITCGAAVGQAGAGREAWSPDPSEEGRVPEAVAAGVGQVARVLARVDHDARDLIASSEETAFSVSRLDSFLQDMARSGKDLESSAEAANRVALEGTRMVEQMEKENELIMASVKDAAVAVDGLARWSEEIGKIVEVIQDITDETNLLALNAAIIAAQSGEQGKAFGVVAEEIRGLAERTSSSTKEIDDLVKAVQTNVSDVALVMKKSLERVERGDDLARSAGRILERVFESFETSRRLAKDIAVSTFEHKIDSSQVVRSVHRLTEIARRLESAGCGMLGEGGSAVDRTRAHAPDSGRPAMVAKAAAAGASKGGSATQRLAGSATAVETEAMAPRAVALARTLEETVARLDQIRQKISTCLETIQAMGALTRTLVKSVRIGSRDPSIKRCWDVVGCGQELRETCPAFRADDWRCFLMDRVSCSASKEGDLHARRRCYDCPAFRCNIEQVKRDEP